MPAARNRRVAKATRTLARGTGLVDRFEAPQASSSWSDILGGLAIVAGLAFLVFVVLGGSGCSDWHHDPARRAACVVRVIAQVGDPGRPQAREWARLGLGLCRDWNGKP